ncbi:DNA-directed RNA polymerase III subunit RPC4-like [Patiria miniata]|uniref:DNA-directed RNA polymerase III subunit RPC4 n=1 Tax=Patiria miniata TaxID=46514 RepID=A0A914A8J0_PATMI|nr:DNA-directed RNA polymerase III subunit RPC4-like [Patiria miniata]
MSEQQQQQQQQQQSPGECASPLPRGLTGRRGGAVNPSTRLPSLRPARDLTLGGVQKRAFKPNLNVAGRKDKSQRESTSKDVSKPSTTKQKNQGSERGDRGRGRGRGRGKPETIQSRSIFEQGPADRLNKKGGGHYGGGGDARTPSSSTKSIKREKMSEEEARRMQEILRDDFVSDLDKDEDDRKYCPIHLPLVSSLTLKKEVKDEGDVAKTECADDKIMEIKKEPSDDNDIEMTAIDTKPIPEKLDAQPKTATKSLPKRTTCAALFGQRIKSEGELMFFQLPDTLPGQPLSNDDEDQRPKVKREPGTPAVDQESQKKTKEDNRPAKCTLESLPEGYLGKLQVLKSGKTRFVLGNATLDVTLGTPCGFLQDLMSIKLDDDDRTGEMTRLGQVKHRIVCTPDFESLLQLAPSK